MMDGDPARDGASDVIQVSDSDDGESSDGTYVMDSDGSVELVDAEYDANTATEPFASPLPPLPSLNIVTSSRTINNAVDIAVVVPGAANNPGSPVPSTSRDIPLQTDSSSETVQQTFAVPQNSVAETNIAENATVQQAHERRSEALNVAEVTEPSSESSTVVASSSHAVSSDNPPEASTTSGVSSSLPHVSPSASPQAGSSTNVRNPGTLNLSVDEFKSPPRKRAKHSSRTSSASANVEVPSSVDEDEGQCCPICFDEWTNSGSHRLCCLKCGHVFGHSCIDRWLRDKKQKGLCPQCNKPAKLKDIRFIFAKSLKVTDTSERDAALRALEEQKERLRYAEMEVAKMRMMCQRANEDCNILRQETVQLKQQLQQLRSQGGVGNLNNRSGDTVADQSSNQGGGGSYAFDRMIKICDSGNCRVMAYSPECATLVVSQPSTSHLFPGFGVKKVSAMDFKTYQFVSIHSKMIRDLCFNVEGCMLSAAMDKNVKITSINSNTIVQTYTCPTPVWSCCWNEDERLHFFAGLANGKVRCYDIRNTREHLVELNSEGSGSPVVSLQYVKMNPNTAFRPGGVLVSQLACSTFFEKKDEDFRPHVLPIEGNLMYMSLEDRSRHILATFRPNNRCPTVKHEVFELSCSNVSADPTIIQNFCTSHSMQSFQAGKECKVLSRSRLLKHPTSDDKMLACAGDEATKSLYIWDTQSGKLAQKIPCMADVLDICSVQINEDNYLAALTDKTVRMHKWTA